jgi:CHAD domain-containing protein
MADGKWIPGLTVETPVVDAARRVLTLRLEVIRRFIPLAAERPQDNVEYVHQLRVATRRARAALGIFAACLPEKRGKTARKWVRHIRRAAGTARDWDVFQEMLRAWSAKRPAAERPGLDLLYGYATQQRAAAQPGLASIGKEKLNSSEILTALEEPTGHRSPKRLAELARPLLDKLLADLDKALGKQSLDYQYLHRVRIAGKRLRYAMEVFADCFAPPFREQMYPAVEEMQEILGAVTDSHLALLLLTELRDRLKSGPAADWSRFRPGIERLLQMQRRRLPDSRRKFRNWRQHWRKDRLTLADLLLVSHRSSN